MIVETIALAGSELYDKCVEMIDTKHKRYFKCSALVDDLLADHHNVDLRTITYSSTRLDDPYFKQKNSLRNKVRRVLIKLESKGRIEKYSRTVWRKIK